MYFYYYSNRFFISSSARLYYHSKPNWVNGTNDNIFFIKNKRAYLTLFTRKVYLQHLFPVTPKTTMF